MTPPKDLPLPLYPSPEASNELPPTCNNGPSSSSPEASNKAASSDVNSVPVPVTNWYDDVLDISSDCGALSSDTPKSETGKH